MAYRTRNTFTTIPANRFQVRSGQDSGDFVPGSVSRFGIHVNFTDPEVIGYFEGGLLAQDELQSLEHPVLGSVREYLCAERLSTLTTEGRSATPILVMGAERRLALDTAPSAERPSGLYGNRFAAAAWEDIEQAVRFIDPPTTTNVLAMAAPVGGFGRYGPKQIEQVIAVAYTGFVSAMDQTRAASPNTSVVFHTGFWGCGAFGGNRVLMSALQVLAANLAGVPRMLFYAFDEAGNADLGEALERVQQIAAAGASTDALIGSLADMGFTWGVGDGN